MMFSLCRVGEARVPGPAADTWSMGICNPSGLQGKHHVLSSIDADILAISETHLSKQARRNLELSFRSMKTRYKHVLAGAPVTPRSTSSDAGHWSGVAFTTSLPCRTLAVDWPPDLYETGRLQFGSFCTPASWVSGAVVYGYPEGKTHAQAFTRTEALLDFALHRLLQQPGPRFLAGDWNFDITALEVSHKLQAEGWIEVQDLYRSKTGADIQMTCKQATRKDFLWLSPDLAMGFQSLVIDQTVFADHAVLVASFAGGVAHMERFPWPCPKPIPWTQTTALVSPVDFDAPADPTQQYALLWSSKESLAQQSLGPAWMPQMKGRGQQLKPKRSVGRLAPIKQGRHSDVQPAFFGFSALHAKQFKQARRLQNYCRWIDNRTVHAAQDMLHGVALWRAILNAPGFAPTFSTGGPSASTFALLTLIASLNFAPTLQLRIRFMMLCLLKFDCLSSGLSKPKPPIAVPSMNMTKIWCSMMWPEHHLLLWRPWSIGLMPP